LHMAQLIPLPPHHLLLLAPVKSRMVYLSGASLPSPPSAAGRPAAAASRMRRAVLGATPVARRLAARADPAQPAVRTISSYRGMDASL